MDFKIQTFVGAGPIRFGMTRQEVRQSLPGPVDFFRRTPEVVVASDHFTELGVFVNYRLPDLVDSVEFGRPSNPIFGGVALFIVTVDQARKFLRSRDPQLEVDGAGFISHTLGVGAYVLMDDPEEDDPGEILSIIAFERDYYGRST